MATTIYQAFSFGSTLAARILVQREMTVEESHSMLRLLQAIASNEEIIVDSPTEIRQRFAELEQERDRDSESLQDAMAFENLRLYADNADHFTNLSRREHVRIANDLLASLHEQVDEEE